MANDNVELGRFDLVGIPSAPRGVPQIEVTFDIDANGIVHVSAKDRGTGKEQSIRITAPQKLDKSEIEKMVKEAERFAQEDQRRKEEVELKNQADSLAYTTERSLKDFGDKVSAGERAQVEEKLKTLKEALKGSDSSSIKQAMEELTQVSHKLAEEVYKASAAKGGPSSTGPTESQEPQPPPDSGSNGQKKKEGVIDAEFKVEDDKK